MKSSIIEGTDIPIRKSEHVVMPAISGNLAIHLCLTNSNEGIPIHDRELAQHPLLTEYMKAGKDVPDFFLFGICENGL